MRWRGTRSRRPAWSPGATWARTARSCSTCGSQAGHELGNHSLRAPDYARTESGPYIADLEKGRATLQAFLDPRGQKVRFFRFPFLREGDTLDKLRAVRDYLAQTGQRNLPVTIDNQDWSFEQPWVEAAQGRRRREAGAPLRGLPARAAPRGADADGARRRVDGPRDAADPAAARERGGHRAVGRALHLDEGARVPLRDAGRGDGRPGLRAAARVRRPLRRRAVAAPAPRAPARAGPATVEAAAARAGGRVDARGPAPPSSRHYAADARFVATDGVTADATPILARYRKRYRVDRTPWAR